MYYHVCHVAHLSTVAIAISAAVAAAVSAAISNAASAPVLLTVANVESTICYYQMLYDMMI